MSYVFMVIKDDEGLRLDCTDAMLQYVPKGSFTINGHHVPVGEDGGYSLGISFSGEGRVASTYMGDAH